MLKLRPTVRALALGLAVGALVPAAAHGAADAADGVETRAFQLPPPALLDDRRPRHLRRALLEVLAVQAGGAVWYWQDLDFNARDWDLRWDWSSWRRKLFSLDTVRFDQNEFGTNARWHPLWGTLEYQIGRGNGLGAGTSFLFTSGWGVFWEYVVESKEYPSLNDLVVNPTAGFALGEPLYQLGDFLARGDRNPVSEALAGLLSPIAGANDWVDGRRRGREAAGALGLSRERWHRFQLGVVRGARTFERASARSEADFRLGSELVMLRGYDRPGRFAAWVPPGAWTSIDGELALTGDGVGGRLVTRTSVAGRYWQDLDRAPDGRVRGTGFLLGLGSGFEYEDHPRPDGDDFLATMNVIGPIWELTARADSLRLRLSGDAYGDFAMVKSLALDGAIPPMSGVVYHPADSGGVMPGVVGARGYYYALGATVGSRLELELGGWDAGVDARADHFASIAGADRFREEMTREMALEDRRLTARSWLGLRPWGQWGRVAVGLQWRWRDGRIDDQQPRRERFDSLAYLQLSLVF